MAQLGLHTFAAAPKWDVTTMRALLPKFAKHKVRVLEIPLLDPAEIDVAETRAFVEETGIAPVCSLGLPNTIDVISDPDAGLAFLEPAFAVAAGVGAFALAGVTYGTIGKISGAPRTQAEFDGTARFIDRAARAAKTHGLDLGVEPCNRYETHIMNTGADGRAYCEAVGAENVFIHLDTYHMNIEEKGVANGILDAREHLKYIHLSESDRGTPGWGTCDWDEVFAALAAIGFKGGLAMESFINMPPEVAYGLSVWRPVAKDEAEVMDNGLPFLRGKARQYRLI